ncbi:c-type cytochrome domain-containing protein [Paraglaciecola aquimarina]|uniref:C-type cytochrome domain-containing protein n=1 Tax=Paraglaciecola aquimarina TaxID=1235557 RepID=A0ABU3SUP9_9ALTE|nr:c-type cytochrome domain-containing protein [Paraglaciecola aquimarina]MDU0353724.1 c-type cytochrome domain-containing protein [Paraglaciecola aquimarina]
MSNLMHPTVKQYFSAVLLCTLTVIVFLVQQNAELKQLVKETLGLSVRLQAADDSFYNDRVQLVFEKYCIGCHDDNKAKGHLRLDSFRQTSFGGKSGDILAGGENSLLLQRMLLPAENRLAMPPYGRDRQTADELEVLKQWLVQGASGQLTADSFPHAPAKVRDIRFTQIDWHAIELARAPLAPAVKVLQQKYPTCLHYAARTSDELIVSGLILREKFNDQVIADFAAVADGITTLDLRHTAISDSAMEVIAKMENLANVNLVGTAITPASLDKLARLPLLENLVIDKHLITLEQVELLTAGGVKVVVVEKSS